MTKTTSIAGCIAGFCFVFLAINILHFRFFPVHVVLYDSVLDLVLTTILATIVYAVSLRPRLRVTRPEAVLTTIIAVLCCTLYALAVPTIIDRSLSVYILEKLNQRGGHIAQSAFEEILRKEFFEEYELVNIRLTEGLNSGTIKIVNGCVNLTPWGERVVAFTTFYRANILPKQREIMGQYTDTLTNPLRGIKPPVPYECRR